MTAIQFVLEWAVRSSILILSGALILQAVTAARVSHAKDPSIRLAAWTVILFASLSIPLLMLVLPALPLPVVRQASRQSQPSAVAPEITRDAEIPTLNTSASVSRIDWPRIALAAYILVALTLLLRLCIGLAISLHLLRQSTPAGRSIEGIEIRESRRVQTPVTLGIARPAILLPLDWRLWNGTKLNAVLTHESAHVRRRDPALQLLSAIHRALLWHSPLSWFLHTRIVRDAEDASDDAAVAVSNRILYAEVLLSFIRQETRRTRWIGVPMARYGSPDKRIDRILDGTALSRGVTWRAVATILALASPLAWVAAAHPQNPQVPAPRSAPAPPAPESPKPLTFDVVSLKPASPDMPGGVRMVPRGPAGFARVDMWAGGGPGATRDPGRVRYPIISLKSLILNAYNIENLQVVGPDWMDTAWFSIEATMPPDTTKEQFQAMLRNLILDRFKLTIHRETKELAGFSLLVLKNGPKMKQSTNPLPQPPRVGLQAMGTQQLLIFQQMTMQGLAATLQARLHQPVIDATGLAAKFDFTLNLLSEGIDPATGFPNPPDLFDHLQSQLGLKLEPKKISMEIVVIDHAEKIPTEN